MLSFIATFLLVTKSFIPGLGVSWHQAIFTQIECPMLPLVWDTLMGINFVPIPAIKFASWGKIEKVSHM